jgi:predicted nucleic acid-binding protein
MSAGEGFFVDSNVLLYYVDPVEPEKRARAAEWLEALWMAGTGRLSWQVLHEFYWNAVRKMRLEPAMARGIVEDISQWRPVDTSLGLVQRAWYWMDSAQVSYWDALILAGAERSGARYLLSEDFQNTRRYEDIQVVNPFEKSPAEFGL